MLKRRFALIATVLAWLGALPGAASSARDHSVKTLGTSCHETTLKINIYNGGIIRTNDGYAFQIDTFGQFDSEFWLADDDLSVCATRGLVHGRVVTHYTLKDEYFTGGDPGGVEAKLISGPASK